MSTVGIKELKDRLTEYLREAQQGEEIVITKRGEPIAMIQSIGSIQPPSSMEARLARLAHQGRVLLPVRKPLKRIQTVEATGPSVSQTILEDRR